ncbi:hypothetical protein MMC30_006820 [Trapelia coarctata]|nr:hypothetical protein [Trapelia coarctata]
MADSLNIIGVVGTWVAAGVAIVALIGIVGPFLVLQQTTSERFQALASVDSSKYVSSGFTPRKGYSFFRKGIVPILDEPPRPGPRSRSEFFAISRTKHPEPKKSPKALQRDHGAVTQTTSSSTGWVNFASTLEMYQPDLPTADKLVIYGRQAWLPVHRFWILAFGLRGRYGDRRDKGKASSSGNATRLRIEGNGAEDRDAAYDSSPLQGRLHGFTGTMWWKVSISYQSGPDEVYFAMHPVADRQPSLLPDPMTLSILSWLALGCLPLVHDPEKRVFDLAGFLSSNQLVHRNRAERRRPEKRDKFYRFERRRDFKGYRTLTKGALNADTADGSGLASEESPTTKPGDATSREWANAMGIDLSKICCMNRWRKRDDTEAEVAKGMWWSVPKPRPSFRDYIWRSDIQTQARAILHVPLSPMGFLFDHHRTNIKPGYVGAECTVFNDSSDKLYSLMHQLEETHFVENYSGPERGGIERLWSCFPDKKTDKGKLSFGRNRTKLSYELDTQILSQRGTLPMTVSDIVGILTLTSKSDSKLPDEFDDNTANGDAPENSELLTADSFLDLLLYCLASPSKAQSFTLKLNVDENYVGASCNGRDILRASMIFKEIFPDVADINESIRGEHQNLSEFVLSALRAVLRGVMFESAVDSTKLLNVVEKMTDVVHMSAKTRPPPLEPHGYIWDRSSEPSIGISASSESASAEVDHDSNGTEHSEHESSHDGGSIGSDENLDLEAQIHRSKKSVHLAEQIRDLQFEFNELQVEAARKRIEKLDTLDRQGRPESITA